MQKIIVTTLRKHKKTSGNNLIKLGITIYLVVIIILGAIALLISGEKVSKKKGISTDPELARAMTYDQFEDGDENIEGTDNVKFSAFYLRDLDGDGYAEKIKRNM